MAGRRESQHVRVALYETGQTAYLFCDAKFTLTDDAMEELRSNAETSPDFVENVRIIFQEKPDPDNVREFVYVVSLNREVSDSEIESLLPTLLGGGRFGERWLMSESELLPRQRRLVRAHQAGALGEDPTA